MRGNLQEIPEQRHAWLGKEQGMEAWISLLVIIGGEFLVRDVLLPLPPQDGSILLAAGAGH